MILKPTINPIIKLSQAGIYVFSFIVLLNLLGIDKVFVGRIFPQANAGGLDGQVLSRHGRVLARGLELRGGKPIWVEIDDQGEVAGEIGVASGNLEKARAMEAGVYKSYGELVKHIKAQYPALTHGAYILTREAYESKDFGSVSVPIANSGPNQAQSISVRIPKPALRPETKSVFVRANETIVDPRLLTEDGPLLLQVPVNLKRGVYQDIGSDVKSVLIDDEGKVAKASSHNIGFKNGFFHSDDAGGEGDPLGPVKGARVEAPVMSLRGMYSITDDAGKYVFDIYKPACPGFQFTHRFNVTATFAMRNFHPEADDFIDIAWAGIPDFTSCTGLSAYFSGVTSPLGGGIGFVEAGVKLHLESIELDISMRNVQSGTEMRDIYVDSTMFAGVARLVNIDTNQALSVSETKYQYEAPDASRIQTANLDVNLDRRNDFVIFDGTNMSVYFRAVGTNAAGVPIDANGEVITEPDLIRIGDIKPDFDNQGLLESIGEEDLKKTDIYIFRMSNGLLVAKKNELDEHSLNPEDNDHFSYRFPIPGSRFSDLCSGGSCGGIALQSRADRREAWQEAQNVADELRPFKSDHIRPGEKIKIIAINRPTGYIGSTIVTASPPKDGRLDIPSDKIIMRPPNLKVTAQRIYKVTSGANKTAPRQYTVGFEGSALTTDSQILIHTEWFDHDGTALPEELEGYSGRIAKTTGANSIQGGDISIFPIKPGSHLQVAKFKGDILGSENFYLHVSGSPQWENPGKGAASSGPLQHRPKNYVPIKVPVFDEDATRQLRNLNSYNRQTGQASIEKVPAVYQWPYRPEMQFSVFNLTQKDTRLQDQNSSGGSGTLSLESATISQISELLLSGDYVTLLYNLIASSIPPLDTIGTPRELIFSLGEEEVVANVASNGTARFDGVEHLTSLKPEDFLSIRLYQNSDSENVLWSWQFALVDIDADSDNTNGYDYPDRTEKEEGIERDQYPDNVITMYPGKRVRVNDYDLDKDKILDFADFSYYYHSSIPADERVQFPQLSVEIPRSKTPSNVRITFRYKGSDPKAVQINTFTDGSKEYLPAPGYLRLWRKPASSRNPVLDYIIPDKQYSLISFSPNQNHKCVVNNTCMEYIFYMEGIRDSEKVGDMSIQVEVTGIEL